MTLEQLRMFVAVADAMSMTRAADALNLTQPAISAAIAAFEARHGAALFDRVGRRLELTEAGRAFLPEARAVLGRAQEAKRVLDDLAGLARGEVRIAASQTVATYWLPARMARFAAARPGIALPLAVGNTAQSVAALLAGDADLGFVEGAVDEPLIAGARIGGDRLGLYVAPDHPLVGRRIARADLASAAWVVRERGSGTRDHFAAALSRYRLSLDDLAIRLELPSNGAVLEAVGAGGLVAAVSELAAASRLAAGSIARLDCALPARNFTRLTHRGRRLSRAARAFVESFGG